MDYRKSYLLAQLRRLLERRTVPQGLRGKDDVQRAEVEAIMGFLSSKAPRGDYEKWWDLLERRIDEASETRAWPTVGEFAKAAKAISGLFEAGKVASEERDPLEGIGKRIAAGEPVGDGWIYGRQARELLASGHVTEDQLRAYRSGLFFAAKDAGGEEYALAMEAKLKARHGEASE